MSRFGVSVIGVVLLSASYTPRIACRQLTNP
jgi:hypothetical protein